MIISKAPINIPSTPFDELSAASNDFGQKILSEIIKKSPQNSVFISGESVSLALQLAALGATGQTFAELLGLLHLGKVSNAKELAAFTESGKAHRAKDLPYEVANSVWISQIFRVRKSYLDICQRSLEAQAEVLDFKAGETVHVINGWVNKKTHGLIPKIIDQLSDDDRMVLINTVYFKQKWQFPFKKTSTSPSNFTLLDGITIKPQMMKNERQFPYADLGNARAVLLPFEPKTHASMLVILPKVAGVPALEEAVAQHLSGIAIVDIVKKVRSQKVNLFLPRFTFEYSTSLKNVLISMGVQISFSDGATFDGMAEPGGEKLKIGDVIHKTKLIVEEESVEAAAATAVRMMALSCAIRAPEPPPIIFHVDRPFVVALVDTATKLAFFQGVITKV